MVPVTDGTMDGAWSAAEGYERYMGRWSSRLARAVVPLLGVAPGTHWLDVGCGTGAVTAAVVADAEPASVLGVDPSPAYVAAATARVTDARARFAVGDATRLTLDDGSVGAVVSGLVLNFVPDPVAALCEMDRVLSRGGQLAVWVWDYGDGMEMLRRFWAAAVAEDPAAAALDEGARFPVSRRDGLAGVLARAGLSAVVEPVEITLGFTGFDDYWNPFLEGQGPAGTYVVGLPAAARQRLAARLRDTLPWADDGSLALPARAWLGLARAPG
jgi:SAM-dependent methyltransferase